MSDQEISIPLKEIVKAAIVAFYSTRKYGTPGHVIGVKCKLCGAEAEVGKELKHDTSCLLWEDGRIHE